MHVLHCLTVLLEELRNDRDLVSDISWQVLELVVDTLLVILDFVSLLVNLELRNINLLVIGPFNSKSSNQIIFLI
jgi:hypothetical protein